MDSSVFRATVSACPILPGFLRDQLLTKSEELTPQSRERIAKKLQHAEEMHLQILEEKGNQILSMQGALKRLLRQEQEAADPAS